MTVLNANEIEPEHLLRLPELKNFQPLYASDYYDGPLSGMLEHDGEELWFHWVDERVEGGKHVNLFAVLRLSPEDLEAERKKVALFESCVGDHMRLDRDGGTREQSKWTEFYDVYGNDNSIPKGELVGWTTDI